MGDVEVENNVFLKIIQNICDFDSLSHAYLIEVNDYDTDLDKIKIFLKLILCKNKPKISKLNCGKCDICKLVDADKYIDIKYVYPETREIKKNQLLDLMDDYNNTSLLENKRIYVIFEADKLNLSAANTLLKFLEEPSDNIVAILLTKNRYKVIETILSRCQILSVDKNSALDEFDNNIAEILEFMKDPNDLFINYNKILDILNNKDIAINCLDSILDIFVNFLRDDKSSYCILNDFSKDDIVRYINVIEEEIGKLEYNVNYKLWLDNLFARLIGGD